MILMYLVYYTWAFLNRQLCHRLRAILYYRCTVDSSNHAFDGCYYRCNNFGKTIDSSHYNIILTTARSED